MTAGTCTLLTRQMRGVGNREPEGWDRIIGIGILGRDSTRLCFGVLLPSLGRFCLTLLLTIRADFASPLS